MAIKGRAKIEFGTGDIRITPVLNNGCGAVCLKTETATPIGTALSNADWQPELSEVIMTFSDTRSIDVLIQKLHAAKGFMEGDLPEDGRQIDRELDLDSFMEGRSCGQSS